MSVVKINAISVPPQAGPELERRFAARAGAVEGAPGFLGFQLLRPVQGDDRLSRAPVLGARPDLDAFRAKLVTFVRTRPKHLIGELAGRFLHQQLSLVWAKFHRPKP